MPDQNSVFVRDLELLMRIGIYDQEKQAPQRVLVSVEATLENHGPFTNDSIEATISYEEIVNRITALSGQKHYALAETFAQDIADLCLHSFTLESVTVEVTKPDIFTHAAGVGARIERHK